tara:strand:+ start:8651 stop:9118 length:468 start_codon:yes stop_codon:yes gene_type:complete
MIVKEVKANLLDTECEFIAHGVNCQNKMGSGVAKAIFSRYPEIKKSYHKYYESNIHLALNGAEDFLTTVQPVEVHDGKVVFNLFTQEYYGYDGKQYVSYEAIEECFRLLAEECDYCTEVAIPKIGCGLAGGDWEIVKELINRVTGNKLDVYVYYL